MRIKLKEISLSRIAKAIIGRILDVQHRYFWIFHNSGIDEKARIMKFKDLHKGKRCFLIANGPSLADMDLSCLKNEITFGMNRIYLIHDKLGFVPTYHFVTNELVLEQFSEDLQSVSSVKFFNWTERNRFKKDVSLHFIRLKYSLVDKFSTDPLKGIWSGGTVTYATLQFIYYMGFTEVYIVGLDHSFKEKGQPNKTEVRGQDKDESHFHPNYFPKGVKWQLPDLLRSEIAYNAAKNQFEKDGRIILDATLNGKCTVFQKIKFDEIKEKCGLN